MVVTRKGENSAQLASAYPVLTVPVQLDYRECEPVRLRLVGKPMCVEAGQQV